jgi:hypothetical protein
LHRCANKEACSQAALSATSDGWNSCKTFRSKCTLPITLKEIVDLKKSSSQVEVAKFSKVFFDALFQVAHNDEVSRRRSKTMIRHE